MSDMIGMGVSTGVVRMWFAASPDEFAQVTTAAALRSVMIRRFLIVVPLVLTGDLALQLLLGESRLRALTMAVIPIIVGTGVAITGGFLDRWRHVRMEIARATLRGKPWLANAVVLELGPAGLRLQSMSVAASFTWAHFPLRREAGDVVVLLTSGHRLAEFQVIPLRAVAPTDRPALRALLDQHTQAVP
jgi:hypothetical protein